MSVVAHAHHCGPHGSGATQCHDLVFPWHVPLMDVVMAVHILPPQALASTLPALAYHSGNHGGCEGGLQPIEVLSIS